MVNKTGKVLLILTGGTIDKVHDPVTERLVFRDNDSPMERALAESMAENINVEKLMAKDSLDLTDEDRKAIADHILDRPEYGSVIVAHGTSTMTVTGRYLKERGLGKNQTIVLTGAFRPFSLHQSDAGFNIGAAITAARLAAPGVYICMHGQVFDPDKVEKDTPQSRFKEVG